MSITITSTQNPRIKFALSLQKASVRKKEQLFLIEGIREIKRALEAGYRLHTVFICPEIAGRDDRNILAVTNTNDPADSVQIIEISREVYHRLAYREGSGGIMVIAHQEYFTLEDIVFRDIPFLLVVEGIEKPGNLGAILRTADAVAIDAVIVCESVTDIYNPNIVRSSLGTLFTNRVVCCSSGEAAGWLEDKGIRIFTTSLSASSPYHRADFTGPSAIVCGSEDRGVTKIWETNSGSNIIIPMLGMADSMNVSVATSVVLYEALRQRDFHR